MWVGNHSHTLADIHRVVYPVVDIHPVVYALVDIHVAVYILVDAVVGCLNAVYCILAEDWLVRYMMVTDQLVVPFL